MSDLKERAALNSILASMGLATGKFVAAFMTGSLGLLSDPCMRCSMWAPRS